MVSFMHKFLTLNCMLFICATQVFREVLFRSNFLVGYVFVQFVQLNDYLGAASKLLEKVLPFVFSFSKVAYKTRIKGTLSFFWHCETFFDFLSPKSPPSILLKSPLVKSGVKRYIGSFDVISELYCVLLRRMRRFANRSFS